MYRGRHGECFRLRNPDLDLKIRIFGFPIERKIRKRGFRRGFCYLKIHVGKDSIFEIRDKIRFQIGDPKIQIFQSKAPGIAFKGVPQVQHSYFSSSDQSNSSFVASSLKLPNNFKENAMK